MLISDILYKLGTKYQQYTTTNIKYDHNQLALVLVASYILHTKLHGSIFTNYHNRPDLYLDLLLHDIMRQLGECNVTIDTRIPPTRPTHNPITLTCLIPIGPDPCNLN
jgi:hypothetical protein